MWQVLAAAGLNTATNLAGTYLAGQAQKDAIEQAGAQNTAALRQQVGINNQQLELARPLLNVRDGVLGVLAQRFGIAAPTPALVRSESDGTALIPVPGVTYKDRAKGASDPRTPVYFDPVNQNFTTQTGAVLAPAQEGIVPGLTEGSNNTVEIRNGQILGLGNRGTNTVMDVPAQVAAPAPVQQEFVGGSQTNPANLPPGTVDGQVAQPGYASPTDPTFNPPAQTPAGNLFDTASGMVASQNATGVSNDQVAALISELQGMTGQDQFDFERQEAERALSRLANSRGLRNSGRELMALRERDTALVGQRNDEMIRNALAVASMAANRADTGYMQTRDLAGFMAGREDQGFNRDLTTAQFGANRADVEIANLFTLAGLGSQGTSTAFNANANLGGAYANQGNTATQLALQGGNVDANMYGQLAQGLGQGLFDFVALRQYMNPSSPAGATPGINPWAASATAAGVS